MHHRSLATTVSLGVIGLASLAAAPSLHAQARFAALIRCSPAPLTERPGIQAEFARPPVMPLEEAFADAESVKRALEYRARSFAMENR